MEQKNDKTEVKCERKRIFMPIITILAVIAMMVVAIVAIANVAEIAESKNEQDDNILTINGIADKEVTPDKAMIFIKINNVDKTAKDSQAENTKLSDKVTASLNGIGINSDSIETSSYYIQEKFEWNPDTQKSDSVGFETINTLKVTTLDVTSVGKIIDTAISNGATGMDSINFDLKKETRNKIKDELIGEATVDAKNKAANLAKSMNVKLGEVKSINNYDYNPSPYVYTPYMYDKGYAGTTISPQKITVTMDVSVTYSLESGKEKRFDN